jgi:hypothetical protein
MITTGFSSLRCENPVVITGIAGLRDCGIAGGTP